MAELQLTGLEPNVTYKVALTAKNSNATSELSAVLLFTTPSTIISGVNSNNLIQLAGGAIFAGNVTGPGVLFNQDGLKGIKSGGASSFFIDSNTGDAYFAGSVVANAGQIGGFRIGPTSLSATNIVIDSGLGLNFGPNKFIVDNLGNASVSGNIIAQSGSFTGALSASVGTIGGWTLGSTDLSSNTVYINSQYGYIEAGTSPNSVVMNKTTGFYAGGGRDGGGNPTSTTPFWVTIDGNLRATNASISGNIVATSGSFSAGIYASVGTIGGFNISSSSLSAGTGATTVGLIPGSYPFFAGNATPSSAPFKVDNSGNLIATNASITGNIVANSGSFLGAITASVGRIGGFTLQSNSLSATNVVLSSTVGLNLGNGIFSVDQNGNLIAQSASISGSISAQSGQIGGFSIKSNSLSATNVVLASDTGLNLGNGAFSVSQAGALKATSASITGDIVAKSGSITGVLAISPSGSIIAGNLTTNYVSIGGAGVQGVQGGLTTFYLPTDGTAPIIGGFKVLQTGLVTVGEVTGKTISGTKGTTTITVSPDNTNLFVGMAVEDYPGYTLIPSGTVITQINGTTISLSTATLGSGTFSGYSIKFVPNGNLIIGTDISNGIIIRGSTVGALTPAIFTRISGAATTDSAGNGFYIGQDGKFRLAGTNGYISIDGSGNLFVSGTIDAASGNFRGTLTSSVGKIGGWNLAASSLYATNILLDTASGIVLGSASQVKLTPGGTASLLNLYASGTIIATSGSFTNVIMKSASIASDVIIGVTAAGALDTAIQPGNGIVSNASDQITTISTSAGLTITTSSTPNAGSRVNLTSTGLFGYDTSGIQTVAIQSSTGNASFTGNIIATSGSFTGALNASVGKIGGWNLAASSLYATNILLDTASGIVLGSASQVKLTPGGTASLLNLYASGTIIATSGSFNGGLYASVGNIGNWTISASGIYSGSVGLFASGTYNSNEIAIFAGSAMANRATAPFRVTYNGNLVAQNASITGNVTAQAGTIASFSVIGNDLTSIYTNGNSPYPYIDIIGNAGYSGLGLGTFTTSSNETSASGGMIILSASNAGAGYERGVIIDPFGIAFISGTGQFPFNVRGMLVPFDFAEFRMTRVTPGGTLNIFRIGANNGADVYASANIVGGFSFYAGNSVGNPGIIRPHDTTGNSISYADFYYSQSASAWKCETPMWMAPQNAVAGQSGFLRIANTSPLGTPIEVAYTATTANPSSKTLKDVLVSPVPAEFEDLFKIEPIRYVYKTDQSIIRHGIFAEDALETETFKHYVFGNPNIPESLAFNSQDTFATMIQYIKKLYLKNKELEERIASLENK